jgi:PAS domain S-box-containing protein
MALGLLSWFSLSLLLIAAFSFLLAVYVRESGSGTVSLGLSGLLIGCGIWSMADGVRLAVETTRAVILLNRLSYVGVVIIPPMLILFIGAYTNRESWTRFPRIGAIFLPSVLSVIIALTNWKNLWQREVTILTQRPPRLISEQFGMAHILWNAWVLLIIVPLVYFFLLRTYQNSDSNLVRRQIIVISLGMAIPAVASALFVTGVTLVDFTPVAFTALFVLSTVAITRYRVLDVVPIARDSIVRDMDAGVIVLNDEDRIVDINRQGQAIIGEQADDILGATVSEPFAAYETAFEAIENVTDGSTTVSIDCGDRTRQYQVTVSPIQEGHGRIRGRVIMFNDVTEQVDRQRQLARQNKQLERQNERLDEFASIVAHDLQNPLQVARGRLEMARSEYDSDDLTKVARAQERMQTLIEDLLAIARGGQSVTEVEAISIATAADTAWDGIDTQQASLDIATDRQVEGDRTRLRQLFENLFVNAIEHGGKSVTVTVGAMDDAKGFYVEDDGPGIPEEERSEVVEAGYTTADDGTGFGLNIVQAVAEAHGWDFRVLEGSNGGARFEFTGVGSV